MSVERQCSISPPLLFLTNKPDHPDPTRVYFLQTIMKCTAGTVPDQERAMESFLVFVVYTLVAKTFTWGISVFLERKNTPIHDFNTHHLPKSFYMGTYQHRSSTKQTYFYFFFFLLNFICKYTHPCVYVHLEF